MKQLTIEQLRQALRQTGTTAFVYVAIGSDDGVALDISKSSVLDAIAGWSNDTITTASFDGERIGLG